MRMAQVIYASNSLIHEKIPFAMERFKTDECRHSPPFVGFGRGLSLALARV
jgi:hypothetical protein